jgi:hypothetical protein
VITNQHISIPIVDEVNYNPVSEGAYYPTAWAVYSDGSKRYVNREVSWWSADMVRAYVNSILGSFVFGRGVGENIEIRATYRSKEVPGGKAEASFYVDVTEPVNRTLLKIGIKNTKDNGWGCDNYDPKFNQELRLKKGDNGKYLMACGLFYDEESGKDVWKDINNNVAWFSSNEDIARVRTTTGELITKKAGEATISAQLAGKEGSITVIVTSDE